MGMFDNIVCRYPLPVKGANDREYQTKDTPDQMLYKYVITESGQLMHKEWSPDEDLPEKWIINHDFNGTLNFYDLDPDGGWIEFTSDFVNGILKDVRLVKNSTNG